MKDIFPCNLSFGDMCTIAKAAQYTQGGTRLQTEDLGNEVVAGALDDRIHPFVIGEVASVQIDLRLSHACVDLPLEVFTAELANKRRGIFAFQKKETLTFSISAAIFGSGKIVSSIVRIRNRCPVIFPSLSAAAGRGIWRWDT